MNRLAVAHRHREEGLVDHVLERRLRQADLGGLVDRRQLGVFRRRDAEDGILGEGALDQRQHLFVRGDADRLAGHPADHVEEDPRGEDDLARRENLRLDRRGDRELEVVAGQVEPPVLRAQQHAFERREGVFRGDRAGDVAHCFHEKLFVTDDVHQSTS